MVSWSHSVRSRPRPTPSKPCDWPSATRHAVNGSTRERDDSASTTEWLETRQTIRRRTRELYESLLRNHIFPTFGHVAVGAITTRHVRQWHARLVAGDRPGAVTVAKSYRLLRTILNTAVEDGVIARNPCVIKGAGVERSTERPVATIEQVYAIADAVELRYRMVVLLATLASLRFGELAARTRRRIDLNTGPIRVTEAASELEDGIRVVDEPKTPAGRRTVAVPPVLLDELRSHLEIFSQSGPGRPGVRWSTGWPTAS